MADGKDIKGEKVALANHESLAQIIPSTVKQELLHRLRISWVRKIGYLWFLLRIRLFLIENSNYV